MPSDSKIFKDMVVFVDFSGYLTPEKKFCIKEFYIVSLTPKPSGTLIEKHFVYREDHNVEKWPVEYQKGLDSYYTRCGIPMRCGKHVINKKQRQNLREYLKPTLQVYVDRPEKGNLLHSLLGNDLEIRNLAEQGYTPPGCGELVCEWHGNKMGVRCAMGRAVNMCLWFVVEKVKETTLKLGIYEMKSRIDESDLPFKKRRCVRSSDEE